MVGEGYIFFIWRFFYPHNIKVYSNFFEKITLKNDNLF